MEQTRDNQMKYIDQEKKLTNEKENCLGDEIGSIESNMIDPPGQTEAGNDDNSSKKVEEQIPDVVISNQIDKMDINLPIESSNKCVLKLEAKKYPDEVHKKVEVFEFDWMSHIDFSNRNKCDENVHDVEATPNHLFLHVEASLDGGVREGMIVEIQYEEKKSTTRHGGKTSSPQFWLARVEAVYGPLLKLCYVGYTDGKKLDIWHDLTQKRLFPLGYCQMNKCQLKAPEQIRLDRPDWEQLALQYLEDVTYDTLDLHHIEPRNPGEGVTPVDRIRIGTVVEVQDEEDPNVFWPAIISRNNGGLLGLTYVIDDGWKADEGFVPSSHVDLKPDVTFFYLSARIFPKGYAKANKDKTRYHPPSLVLTRNPEIDIKACLEWEDLAESPPTELFGEIIKNLQNVPKTTKEAFQMGKEIEIIHPHTQATIERAVIIESCDENFFKVKLLDAMDCSQLVVRHCLSPDILPSGWSESLSMSISPLSKDSKNEKIPKQYFNIHTNTENAFMCHQKLEVRQKNGEFHTGTIIEIKEHILIIDFDTDTKEAKKNLFITAFDSMDIFPLGWSQINGLALFLPPSFVTNNNSISEETRNMSKNRIENETIKSKSEPIEDHISSWCPEIYFNYKCYSASFLSKARLASLPRSVGPGTVRLVMRTVIGLLVGSSYKSGSILKRLECNSEVPRKDFVIEEVKGKSRVLNLKANIEIPTRTYQVEKMCKDVCQKVGACPNLVSMQQYLTDDGCPADCQNRPKSNFLLNEEDGVFVDSCVIGGSQNGNQRGLLSGLASTIGIGIKRRRDGRRKKRTNPDRLLIAEHIQLKRQKTQDQSTVGSSCEVSSGGSDMEDEDNSVTSTTESSRAQSRCNSPNSQMYPLQGVDILNSRSRIDRREKRRGRKEWERLLPKSEMRTRGNKLPDFNLHFKMRYSKKELAESATSNPKGAKGNKPYASLSNILRPAQNISSIGQANSKKRGRVRLELIPAFTLSDFPPDVKEDESRSMKCEKSRAEDIQSYSYSSDDSDEVNRGDEYEDMPPYEEEYSDENDLPPIRNIRLSKNPEEWSVSDTVKFLAQTSDCAHLASFIREDAIDGHAFLLLNYPTVKEYWRLKTETAINLCQHIESVRLAHIMQFS